MNEGQISTILKSKSFAKINIYYKVLAYDEAIEFIPKLKKISKTPRLKTIVLIINSQRRQSTAYLNPEAFITPGHWFAIFINIEKNSVYIFDSYGTQLEVFKHKFALLFSELWQSKLNFLDITVSEIQVQAFGTTTCGDHCLYATYNLVILGYPFKVLFENIYKKDSLLYNDYIVRSWLCYHTGLCGAIKLQQNYLRSQTFKK